MFLSCHALAALVFTIPVMVHIEPHNFLDRINQPVMASQDLAMFG
jgi:hypothetical protein